MRVQWPYGWTATQQQNYSRVTWHGTLIEQKRDGSGLLFRRNRYVDPATGRFTQEDPIGLAGGLNLYGFASGDPVNFSDPFGVCSQADGWKEPCWRPKDLGSWSSWKQWASNAWSGRAAGTGPASARGVAYDAAMVYSAGDGGTMMGSAPVVVSRAYKRPSNATTAAQRASVQGEPCVTCGATTGPRIADHKVPLVVEYYETGTIDLMRMRSLDAVQPQCPFCSASQGGTLRQYSTDLRTYLGLPRQ